MAGAGGSGLEVLLSTLQNPSDTEGTLTILNVLDELLSAGTDRRIHYMISKGGSEALLQTLVNTAKALSPNYTVLLPLLHLLAKVGHRDKKIGQKAEKVEAVLLVLNLLRLNIHYPKRAAACLWVLRVFCSCVSAAALLGKNRALDVVFKLITPHSKKHTRMIKAAIDALAALLNSKSNVRCTVGRGYISALLKLYEDWHLKDTDNRRVPIRRALLHCLHHATSLPMGRSALMEQGGMRLLFHTTQACLANQALESLVMSATQLMRKCYPKCPFPLSSDQSVYSFPLPGSPPSGADNAPCPQDGDVEEESDEEKNDELESKEEDDDLETDLTLLRMKPEPDRTLEQLGQYVRLCPELHHDFKDLDSDSEAEDSSDEDGLLDMEFDPRHQDCTGDRLAERRLRCSEALRTPEGAYDTPRKQGDLQEQNKASSPEGGSGKGVAQLNALDVHRQYLSNGADRQEGRSLVDTLLERHGATIFHHDPRLYATTAVNTKSIARYSVLAFPDFWGHLPPPYRQPCAERKEGVQRKKVFEDIQRLLCPEDIINKVVFDVESDSLQSPADDPDSLRFYSQFESGNLRKAVQVRRCEYDLILNSDVNSSSHHQWFYFEVSGMKAGLPYRFNIVNCEKVNSQFNYGMQPVLYSVREALEGRPHWVRTGSEICYYRNHSCQCTPPARGQKSHPYYTLTFTVTFQHEDDVCYLAYHYPYTYTALQTHLQLLQQSVDPSKVFFQQQTLCATLAGNPCPLVTITACPAVRSWKHLHQLRNRPCIVLTARVHPGESNASWVMKGTLEFLCSTDPVAESLRETYIFKIIPMLNPDGVINGMHRCSLSGEDLNRQWLKPDPTLSPTIYHTKGFLYYLNSIGRAPLVFCDYHGHSRKKNVFLYGCSVKETLWESGVPLHALIFKEDPGYRTLPKVLDRIAPAFSFNSCNFLVEKSRGSTARVVVWREMGVQRSYTMESTYNSCNQGVYKGLQLGTRELEEMGAKFCQSLLSLKGNTLLYSKKLIKHASALLNLDDNILDHKSHSSFEDDEPPCVEEIEYQSDGCGEHSGDELDDEVNGNTESSDEEDEEHGSGRFATIRNGLLSCDRKPCPFPKLPQPPALETLNTNRNAHGSVNISSNKYLS
nr:PREDICTED: cytosolic carboxypeptidase 4 isoform X2 [Lepisosteus oculatus]